MSEEQMTVEKIEEFKNRGEKFRAQFKRSMIMGMVEFELFDGVLDSIGSLLSQLATIERDTAEWCNDLAEDMYDHSNPAMGTHEYNDDIGKRIRSHFNLGEKP